jgi:hypothetical protein
MVRLSNSGAGRSVCLSIRSTSSVQRLGLLLLLLWALYVVLELSRSAPPTLSSAKIVGTVERKPTTAEKPKVELAKNPNQRKISKRSAGSPPQAQESDDDAPIKPTTTEEPPPPPWQEDAQPTAYLHPGVDDGKSPDHRKEEHLNKFGFHKHAIYDGGKVGVGNELEHEVEDAAAGKDDQPLVVAPKAGGDNAAVGIHGAGTGGAGPQYPNVRRSGPSVPPHAPVEELDLLPHQRPASVKYQHGVLQHQGNGQATYARKQEKSDRLRLVLFTTLKPCFSRAIEGAQTAAIRTWASLPLDPPPTIFVVGTDPCGLQLLDHLEGLDVRLEQDVPMGLNATVLLGGTVEKIMKLSPEADVYGFLNADILLSPVTAVALHLARHQFTEFFMVGRRDTIDLPEGKRNELDFTSRRWEADALFHSTRHDRVDAEDYFLWTKGFFTNVKRKIPNFHIGRPAYDNWLIHTAIHSWQPVIEATAVLKAYHQKHNYDHLKINTEKRSRLKQNEEEDEEPPPQGGGADGGNAAGTPSYWKSAEQKENYDLGIANGGWQHGLIDMTPLGFRCSKKAKNRLQQWQWKADDLHT